MARTSRRRRTRCPPLAESAPTGHRPSRTRPRAALKARPRAVDSRPGRRVPWRPGSRAREGRLDEGAHRRNGVHRPIAPRLCVGASCGRRAMPRPVFVPPIDPAAITPPSREVCPAMGEENIFRMIADFYAELERSSLRSLFPADMVTASRRSGAFFVGLLGGPPLYHQRYGNPMMRARHLAFAITPRARREWLACFDRVLERAPERYAFPTEHLPGFRRFLRDFSLWMVNTDDGTGDLVDEAGDRRPDPTERGEAAGGPVRG